MNKLQDMVHHSEDLREVIGEKSEDVLYCEKVKKTWREPDKPAAQTQTTPVKNTEEKNYPGITLDDIKPQTTGSHFGLNFPSPHNNKPAAAAAEDLPPAKKLKKACKKNIKLNTTTDCLANDIIM